MHVYAFGSLCRGEIRPDSDIDLLAIVDGYDSRFDQNVFSIYSYTRLAELWNEGNPFGWHLFLESRLIFSADGSDFLQGWVRRKHMDDAAMIARASWIYLTKLANRSTGSEAP